MPHNYVVGDEQPQPSALTHILGGEKGVEHPG